MTPTELQETNPTTEVSDKAKGTIGDPSFGVDLTLQEVKNAVPARFNKAINQEFVDHLNAISKDPLEASHIKDNFITFGSVLDEGRFSISDYTNAIKYLTYLMLNHTKASAYSKTFPDRYARLTAGNKDARYISAYVSAYDSGKLVNELRKQTLVPVYIHNRPLLQRAINTQAEIMLDTNNSAFVRSTAATSLMNCLKEPTEVAQLNIAVNNNVNDNSAIEALTDALNKLSDNQEKAVIDGEFTTKQIAELDITSAVYSRD